MQALTEPPPALRFVKQFDTFRRLCTFTTNNSILRRPDARRASLYREIAGHPLRDYARPTICKVKLVVAKEGRVAVIFDAGLHVMTIHDRAARLGSYITSAKAHGQLSSLNGNHQSLPHLTLALSPQQNPSTCEVTNSRAQV